METGTPIDHKRVQGILVFIAGILITKFTDWEIGTEDLTFGVGEGIYIFGILYSYYGGMVAKGPIEWFKSDTIKVDLEKLTPDEKALYLKLTEKGK